MRYRAILYYNRRCLDTFEGAQWRVGEYSYAGNSQRYRGVSTVDAPSAAVLR